MSKQTKPEPPANTMPERIWANETRQVFTVPVGEWQAAYQRGFGEYIRADIAEAQIVALTAERGRLREALKAMVSVYEKNIVQPGEPSSILDAARAALESTQPQENPE